MKLTRYEVFYEGEDQLVGFMHGLDDFDVEEDRQEILLKPFEEQLIIPPIYQTKRKEHQHEFWKAYFTEEGVRVLKDAIEHLQAYWEEWLGCTINVKQIDLDPENSEIDILYQDAFQVVTREAYE